MAKFDYMCFSDLDIEIGRLPSGFWAVWASGTVFYAALRDRASALDYVRITFPGFPLDRVRVR